MKTFRCLSPIGLIVLLCSACANEQLTRANKRAFEDPAVAEFTVNSLQRFQSEAEFERYVRAVTKLSDLASMTHTQDPKRMLVQNETSCAPTDPDCEESESLDSISVSGTRISAAAVSITNNQSLGVDEGDIVKQIGEYLVVLQDGRIFVTHAEKMQLTDRINVYRPRDPLKPKRYRWQDDFDGADWYDEMLVFDRFVIIIAFSYEHDATELSVFELDAQHGKLTRRSIHLIPSWDYYSSSNYASRLVGDQLVLRTSVSLADASETKRGMKKIFPDNGTGAEEVLLKAQSIFKPLLQTRDPYLHQITLCSLAELVDTSNKNSADVRCKAIAFVGPTATELYVSPNYVYLWNMASNFWFVDDPPTCESMGIRLDQRARRGDVSSAAVYRVATSDFEVQVASGSGWIADQFHMDEYQGTLRALVDWDYGGCYFEADERLKMLGLQTFAGSAFSTEFDPKMSRVVALPSVPNGTHARFIDQWLVYSAAGEDYPLDMVAQRDKQRLHVLRVRNPKETQQVSLDHQVVRLERLGDHVFASGYRDSEGLHVSVLALKLQAKVLDHIKLPNYFESEGRSHAFNYTVEPDGITMAVPTVQNENETGRWYWYSEQSNLSYLQLSKNQLKSLSALRYTPVEDDQEKGDAGYSCEVSCIDWYGNARPIFSSKGWFGLMGTELVEVQVESGQIVGKRRLDLTQAASVSH